MNEDAGNEAPEVPAGRATISDRIAAFAMVDQMKDATQAQKCMRLSLVGFSASEIAGMLQTTVPTVHQNLYAERKTQALGKEVPHGREAVEELGRELAQTSLSRCLPRRALGNGFRGSARRVFAGISQTNKLSWVPREMNLEADTLASRALGRGR